MSSPEGYASIRFSEPQLRERNKALATLLDLGTFLSASHGLTEVLEGALGKVVESFELSAGRIYLMSEDGSELILRAHRGLDVGGLERVRNGEGFTGKSARTRSFIAQHVTELEDADRVAVLLGKGLQIVVCVPLIAMGRLVGVMNLASERIVDFEPGDVDLLIAIGNQIAVAANHALIYEELLGKVEELEAQKRAIEFFAYSISHDLKSPAIGIYGLTRRLHDHCREALGERGQLYCDQILKATEQIVRLVDRINAYISAKESVLHFESFSLKEATELIRNEFSEPLSRRHVAWKEPESLPSVVADRLSVLRILRNLVDNALKYGGEELREIGISCREEPERLILCVSDDGVPLLPEDAEKLFEPFSRHEGSRGVEGTGLGLATVKKIAERHGGSLWLESAGNQGTTFCIAISRRLFAKA